MSTRPQPGATGTDSGPSTSSGAGCWSASRWSTSPGLSTHPVPMISQGLVTVAGQGPKDSNGAGKSS